jgi:hypothetical protein
MPPYQNPPFSFFIYSGKSSARKFRLSHISPLFTVAYS